MAGGVLLERGTSGAFRHDLARQAILDGLAPAGAALHRRVLETLTVSGSRNHRRLAQHAVACGDAGAVIAHAPQAAALASRPGSHREAAQHLRTALQHSDRLDPAPRADLLDRFSRSPHTQAERVAGWVEKHPEGGAGLVLVLDGS